MGRGGKKGGEKKKMIERGKRGRKEKRWTREKGKKKGRETHSANRPVSRAKKRGKH